MKDTLSFRSFSGSDWDGFSGATQFAPGVRPLIAEFEGPEFNALVILDAKGLEINFIKDDEIVKTFITSTPEDMKGYPETPTEAESMNLECVY